MMSDKKLDKILKILGHDVTDELASRPPEGLEAGIAASAGAIKEAEEALEANPKYQELKASLKACSAGLREVRQFQNAKIQYALHLLEERQRMNPEIKQYLDEQSKFLAVNKSISVPKQNAEQGCFLRFVLRSLTGGTCWLKTRLRIQLCRALLMRRYYQNVMVKPSRQTR